MMLCFVRHAVAADRETWKEEDETRPLTTAGAKKMKKVAKAVPLLTKDFTYICTSPLRRAKQTAKILARNSGHSGELLVWNELVPEAAPQSLQKKLQSLSEKTKTARPRSKAASRRAASSASRKNSNHGKSAAQGNSVRVALVGHEPQLSRTVSYFLCGDPNKMSIAFKKSGICCLEYDGKIPATLRWFVPPRFARSIARGH